MVRIPQTLLTTIAVALSVKHIAAEDAIKFSRQVLPFLSDRWFHFRGPEESHREDDLLPNATAVKTRDLFFTTIT